MQMRICVINTGGTISCVGEPLAPMSAKDFAAASRRILDPIVRQIFPDLEIIYETGLVFPESSTGTLDSTNLQPSDWCLMAGFILENYGRYDGFVILHGTDTMDFTGSALPFLLNRVDADGFALAALSKPVIITGSQVPMYYQAPGSSGAAELQLNFNTDAYQNFCGAVACARVGMPEVGVFFDTRLYRGSRVLKINASQFRAFDSPNYPPLATYGIELELHPQRLLPGPVSYQVSLDNPMVLQTAKAQLAAIQAAIDANPVMRFNAFPAPYSPQDGSALIADLITACVAKGLKGLILQSYGEGNFPSGNPDHAEDGAVFQALDMANRDGVVIMDCTQVMAGVVDDFAYASGAWLPSVGALSAADMTSMAGLAKTIILRSAAVHNGWGVDDVKSLLQLNLCGEVMNVSRLDSRQNGELLPGQSIRSLDGSAMLRNDPKSGPKLTASDGTPLWSPFRTAGAGKPGRLVMHNDGNLVLYDEHNAALWATDTGNPSGASSALTIDGSYQAGSLCLRVYDYSGGRTSATLYLQSSSTEE